MSSGRPEDPLVERMRGFGTTIFAEMSALALQTGSVNLEPCVGVAPGVSGATPGSASGVR